MAFQYASTGGPSGFAFDSGDWVSSATLVRPGADVLTTGWQASTGSDLFDMIDEASADDADYIYRDLAGSDPYVFELWLSGVAYSLPAGSHVVRMRADVTAGAAQARLLLLDASDNVVGTGAWQSLTPGFAAHSFSVTTAAAATRGRIEAAAA
jgi:hypothetical protein